MSKLTAALVRKLPAGMHGDGNGLWLQVSGAQQRSWLFRFTLNGKPRMMGLGSVEDVSLADARDKAAAARKLVRDGIDPIEQRKAERKAASVEVERATTFRSAAEAYIAAHEPGWRSAVHQRHWRASLDRHAYPVMGAVPVSEITTQHVLDVVQPIWKEIPETASRLRGRIEMVLSYATARGWRKGPNPAVWRGHLQIMLPSRAKVRAVEHFAALDWHEAPAFMAQLRERDSFGARALEFAIYTVARPGEVRFARWDEIDLDGAVWTIPAARMKAGRPHKVPLSKPALAILREMAEVKDGSGLIFLGQKFGVPMSDVTLLAVLRRMERDELTVHGFRSTFRDWAAEATHHPNHVIELALAHTIGDKVEAAYSRGDLFEKRKRLMTDWAEYLARRPAEAVQLKEARGLPLAT